MQSESSEEKNELCAKIIQLRRKSKLINFNILP